MKNSNEHIDYAALTGKYLANEATPEEVALLEKWVLANDENKKLFNRYRQAWILTQPHKIKTDIDAEWNKLEKTLFAEDDINKTVPLYPKKSIPQILKIAAVILIALTASYFLYRIIAKPVVENVIAMESVKPATLPDGTVVALNKNSAISFPAKFKGKKREVLLKGEAFFQVKRDEEKPFVIEAGSIEIEVLGTSFNVNARPESPVVEVVVNSGKVAVRSDNGKEITLIKGERGTFLKQTGELVKELNKSRNYLAWKTKKFVFEDDPLQNVVKDLTKVYDVKFEFADKGIKELRLTATFDNLSLDAVLNILEETFDIEIERKEGVVVLTLPQFR